MESWSQAPPEQQEDKKYTVNLDEFKITNQKICKTHHNKAYKQEKSQNQCVTTQMQRNCET